MANTIGTVTRVAHLGGGAGKPFLDVVSFPGATAIAGGYNTGGNSGLLAALQALTLDGRVILSALCMAAGGYRAEYVVATDLVKVYGTGSANKAPGTEIDATTALDGVTFFFLILSQ